MDTLLLLFLTLGGGWMFLTGVGTIIQGILTLRWPSTQGQIIRSEILETKDSEDDTIYTPHVVYEYAVEGRRYKSDRIGVGKQASGSWKRGAERITERYPVAVTIDVYYNPRKPHKAVLRRGFNVANLIVPVFGFILLVLGLSAMSLPV